MISYKLTIKQNEQLKEYEFNSVELGSLGDVQDELNIDNGKITITKRIGMNNEFLSYVLDTPIIIPIETDYIELFDGKNEIEIETISGNYRVLYVTNDPFNYSTMAKDRVKLTLAVLDNQINMKVQKGSIISEINQSSEEIKVSSSKVKLEGITTINDGFEIDLQGNMQCKNANINNLVNQSGTYNTLIYQIHNVEKIAPRFRDYWELDHYVGYKLNRSGQQRRVPIYINYSIPEDFIIDKAYLEVKHFSVSWTAGALGSYLDTRVQDVEVYLKPKTDNSVVYTASNGDEAVLNPQHFIGTRIDNIWGSGIHSYTFPIGRQTRKTEDIASVLNINKKGIIAIAPQAPIVTLDTTSIPDNMKPLKFSAYMSATLYVFGYLSKGE